MSDRKVRRGFESPGAARDFSPESTSRTDSLTVSVHPRVQSHVLASVRTLQIPNTGSHTTVWTHESTAHTDRNG